MRAGDTSIPANIPPLAIKMDDTDRIGLTIGEIPHFSKIVKKKWRDATKIILLPRRFFHFAATVAAPAAGYYAAATLPHDVDRATVRARACRRARPAGALLAQDAGSI